jgi:hypothetical protein
MPTRRDILKLALTFPTAELLGPVRAQDEQGVSIPKNAVDRQYPFTAFRRDDLLLLTDLPRTVRTRYELTIKKIYLEMDTPEMRYHFGESFDDIVKRLRELSSTATTFLKTADSVTKQLISAEVTTAWVRHNIRYYLRPQKERKNGNLTAFILKEEQPKCDCSGFSRLTYDLSRALGLECFHAGGSLRGFFETAENPKDVHGWVVFIIGNKKTVADTSNSWKYYPDNNGKEFLGKSDGGNCIPLKREEWEIFLSSHYVTYYISDPNGKNEKYDWLSQEPLIKLDWQKWASMETKHLEPLKEKLRISDIERNRRLN